MNIFSRCSCGVTVVFLGAHCIRTNLVTEVSHVIHNPETVKLPYVSLVFLFNYLDSLGAVVGYFLRLMFTVSPYIYHN